MNIITKALTGLRRKSLNLEGDLAGFDQVPFTALEQFAGPLAGLPQFGIPGGMYPSQANAILYAVHPGCRAVIDTLARNVAHLPLGAFSRDNRGNATPLSATNPLPEALRQIDWMQAVVDLLVQGEMIYTLVDDRVMVRLDPVTTTVEGRGSLITGFTAAGQTFSPEDVLYVKFYNPLYPRRGLSPLTSLRGLVGLDLAEQEARLRRAGMPPVVIKRPMDAPKWGDAPRRRFEERIAALLRGALRGNVPTLEEGMELEAIPAPSESDYVASRTMVLTQICSVLGVPSQSASITDRNLDAAVRALYREAIGPLCAMIEAAIDSQLAPRLLGPTQTAGDRIYAQFSIEEKLRGSFREEADAFSVALGGAPYMVPNEVRAIKGLPPVAGGDVLPPTKTNVSNQATS